MDTLTELTSCMLAATIREKILFGCGLYSEKYSMHKCRAQECIDISTETAYVGAMVYCLFCVDKVVLQLSQELKRLQRRKAMMSGEGTSSQSSTGSGSGPGSPGNIKEQPLFTLKQVSRAGHSLSTVTVVSWVTTAW